MTCLIRYVLVFEYVTFNDLWGCFLFFFLANKVQVTFPESSEKSDVVKIRGPKQDVDAVYKHLSKIYKELQETSYSVKVSFNW